MLIHHIECSIAIDVEFIKCMHIIYMLCSSLSGTRRNVEMVENGRNNKDNGHRRSFRFKFIEFNV